LIRQAAVESILERNPNAFRPKIQVRALYLSALYTESGTLVAALCNGFVWQRRDEVMVHYVGGGWMDGWMDGWMAFKLISP
jgi:hypothetical protein